MKAEGPFCRPKASLQTRVPEISSSVDGGAEQRVLRAQTRERGPPSALAEFFVYLTFYSAEFGTTSEKLVKDI